MKSDVDRLFDGEPTPPPLPAPPDAPIGERIAAQTPGFNPVTAAGAEMRSYEHLDKRLDFMAGEIRDGFRALSEQLAEFTRMYGPRIERIESRQDDIERRVAALEAEKRRKAGKKNVR